jgi:hypothetical protein
MMQLTFHDGEGNPMIALGTTELRISGAVIWNSIEYGLIAHYSGGAWWHRGREFASVGVAGGSCLLFGTAREPTILSEPIGLFSLTGGILRANGVPIAQYVEQSDMWQGLIRPFWWNAMRIIGLATAADFVGEPGVLLQSPWDAAPKPARDLH